MLSGKVLGEAGAAQARALLDLTASPEETMEVRQPATEKYEVPLVVSRIADVELIPQLQEMGVRVVQPGLATAMALQGAIRYPTAFEVLVHQTENIEVSEITVTSHHFTGVPLGNLRFPGDVLVLSLQRDGSVIIPHGDTSLRLNDRLGLIGSPTSFQEVAVILKG